MRVLYLNPFSQQVSGPDESLLTLLQALMPMGVEPHLVLPKPGPQVHRYERLGVKVHFAPLTVLSRAMGTAGFVSLGPSALRSSMAVARIARRERIELIHTNMEVVLDGAIVSSVLRLPHVLHYRGNTNDDPKLVFDLLTWFWTATAERVVCISEATAAIFRKRAREARVEVIYNPVDVERFSLAERSEEVRAELGAAVGDILVGTIGRIHPRKDIATFLRAAARVRANQPRARFVVVGAAEALEEKRYLTELQALSHSLGLGECLVWAGARRDMPAVFKALDVFILCSRNEGFGRVVPEAVAAGLQVVASREGALPEVLAGDPAARLAEPGNDADFAAKTLDLLQRSSGPSAVQRTDTGIDVLPTVIAGQVLRVYRSVRKRSRRRTTQD